LIFNNFFYINGAKKVGPNVMVELLWQTWVKEMFLRPDLMGQKVTLEGRIVSQCASNGCWFYLQDDTGQVYIDLSRNGFELPSLPNKTAIASGTVARTQQAYLLIATGVEVK